MPSTPNLAIPHIEESQDDKEVTANEGLDLLDKSKNTWLVIAMSDANFALTAAQQNEAGTIELTGTLTANRTITVPANDRKVTYFNNTTGGFSLTFTKGSGTTVTLGPKAVAEVSVDTSANVLIKVGGGNLAGALDDLSGTVITPEDGTIVLKQSAARGFTITSFVAQLAEGTCTVAIKINGVDVTGLSAVSVSGTESTTAATAANTVVAGDLVTMVLTNTAGSPATAGLGFSLMITYTE